MSQPDAVYDALFYNYSPDIIIDRIAGIAVVIAPRFKLKYFAKSDDDAISYALNLSNQLASASIYHIVLFKVGLSPVNNYTFNPTYALLIGNVPTNKVTSGFNITAGSPSVPAGNLYVGGNLGVGNNSNLNFVNAYSLNLDSGQIPNIYGANLQNFFKGNNVAVAAGATSLAVTLPITLPSTNYAVYVTPQWNTSYWITGKTTTGFTINFGTAAPTGGSYVDWVIFF